METVLLSESSPALSGKVTDESSRNSDETVFLFARNKAQLAKVYGLLSGPDRDHLYVGNKCTRQKCKGKLSHFAFFVHSRPSAQN